MTEQQEWFFAWLLAGILFFCFYMIMHWTTKKRR